MIRRFNYTGRKKIDTNSINIVLMDGSNGIPEFRASINLNDYDFPIQSKVYLEAYYKSSMMRFDYGTIATAPSKVMDTHTLGEIYSSICFFRVKVVDESSEIGRIIGVADRIAPVTNESKKVQKLSLMYVVQQDIGNRIWKLELGDDYEMPILYINTRIDTSSPINEIVRSNPLFNSLVFPAIVEQVLTHILFIDTTYDETSDDWRSLWLNYASQLGEPIDISILSDEQKQEWLDSVVDQFCLRQNMISLFEESFRDEET